MIEQGLSTPGHGPPLEVGGLQRMIRRWPCSAGQLRFTPLTPLLVSRGSEAGDEGESFAGRRNDRAAGDLNPGDRSKRLGSCRIANGLVEPDAKTASAVLQSN